jgi:hypothetical protein
VTRCVPVERFVAVNCPEPALSVAEPRDICESRNVMVPVGVPDPPAGETFELKVTRLPAVICVAEADSEMLVFVFAGGNTVMEIVAEVEGEKFASPE